MHNTPAYTPEKDADKIIEALRICADGDGEACASCHYGPTPGTDCCAELMTAAADVLEAQKRTAAEAAAV